MLAFMPQRIFDHKPRLADASEGPCHMWMPPFGKGFYERSCNTIGCSHMSGLTWGRLRQATSFRKSCILCPSMRGWTKAEPSSTQVPLLTSHRRDCVPTVVPHPGRESSKKAAPLFKTAHMHQAGQRRRRLGSIYPIAVQLGISFRRRSRCGLHDRTFRHHAFYAPMPPPLPSVRRPVRLMRSRNHLTWAESGWYRCQSQANSTIMVFGNLIEHQFQTVEHARTLRPRVYR
jgi:hypothetical protein